MAAAIADTNVIALVRNGAPAVDDEKPAFAWPDAIAEGARSDTLYKGACSLFAHHLPREYVARVTHAMNRTYGRPPMGDTAVESIVDSAAKHEEPDAWSGEDGFSDMPEARTFGEIVERDIPQAPEIIEGMARLGRKMMLAAPSKAGKTILIIWLALCFVTGGRWLGRRCARGNVLYVDFENDESDFRERVRDVAGAMGCAESDLSDGLIILNMRGYHMPSYMMWNVISDTARKIDGLVAIIIDPIYKIMDGDENNSETVSGFTKCIDRIIVETGVTVVYVHHYSKGAMAYSDPMNRASGSGVFARDPDTQLDMARLHVDSDVWRAHLSESECRCIDRMLAERGHDLGEVPESVREDSEQYRMWFQSNIDHDAAGEIISALAALDERLRHSRAFRVSFTLRGFGESDPINLWYEYPAHVLDTSGLLTYAKYENGQDKGREKGAEVAKKKRDSEHSIINQLVSDAVDACYAAGEMPTRANVLPRMGKLGGVDVSKAQLANWTTPSKAPWASFGCDAKNGNMLVNLADSGDE